MSGVGPRSGYTGPVPLPAKRESIWGAAYIWVSIGGFALIFFAALQQLAVTTVMPVVSAELDGGALYAVAFSGTFATGVIGMVAAGAAADRIGPAVPLYISVALFIAGMAICAFAPSMEILVAGRLIMGFGTGGQMVSLYVVVARVYPARLHGPVFASYSAAWIVPSLLGPFLAGAVTEFLHWRWVFGGVAILALVAIGLIAPRLRGLTGADGESDRSRVAPRLMLAVAVALAALVLSLSGEVPSAAGWIVAAGALLAIAFAIRPLVPRGTLRARTGLPSVVLMRGLVAGALYGAEIYVPYLLIAQFGFSSMWAGLGLTAASIFWAIGAHIQGRHGERIGNLRLATIGIALLATATTVAALTVVLQLPAAVPIAAWALAGGGMGLMYPRLNVLAISYSSPANQGFNSSALQIADSVGASATMAVMGLAFTALAGTSLQFPVVFGIAAALALIALIPGVRLGHAAERRRLRPEEWKRSSR